jgi:hypothetical protein
MKTVAIVGNGRTRVYAPHDDPAIDIWTMNNHALLWKKRTTAVFEMHPDALTAERYDEQYKDWLRQPHDFPIYMHEVVPEIPASKKFPGEKIFLHFFNCIQKGDKYITDFYTTTPPYCMALAAHLGYTRVELYGIDMEHEERVQHRDSVFFWLGILTARGVQVYIPGSSTLMSQALYPFGLPTGSRRIPRR